MMFSPVCFSQKVVPPSYYTVQTVLSPDYDIQPDFGSTNKSHRTFSVTEWKSLEEWVEQLVEKCLTEAFHQISKIGSGSGKLGSAVTDHQRTPLKSGDVDVTRVPAPLPDLLCVPPDVVLTHEVHEKVIVKSEPANKLHVRLTARTPPTDSADSAKHDAHVPLQSDVNMLGRTEFEKKVEEFVSKVVQSAWTEVMKQVGVWFVCVVTPPA